MHIIELLVVSRFNDMVEGNDDEGYDDLRFPFIRLGKREVVVGRSSGSEGQENPRSLVGSLRKFGIEEDIDVEMPVLFEVEPRAPILGMPSIYWWEGLMSPQTETKASVGVKAVTPQPGVPPEEAGAAVAAESSIGTWTTVWTDGLTNLDRYKGRCYGIEPVAGEDNQYICYIAYPLDLFEEGSVTNMFTSIVGNVFGFKALRALRLEDLRIPAAYAKTFQGPPHGIQVERDKLNKYGRPLLGCTIKLKLGLSAKNYGRAVYEVLRGGLDFTKDDENVNSQPFMRWRDRFLFCAEAIYKAQAETGEIKGHYLNATAATCEEMTKRAVFARELGVPIVMHDYLTSGFTANTSLSHYCRDNSLLLHIHRAMHAVIDRQKNHGIHFCVLAKALRMSGGDHIHSGTVVGKLEGEREITLGFVDLLRDDFIEKDRTRGIYFTQDWASLPGHPWGNAPGVVTNRVALEECVQARNEGRDLAREGNEIIREACKWSPELAAACEVWKEIKFEFEAMDTLTIVTEDSEEEEIVWGERGNIGTSGGGEGDRVQSDDSGDSTESDGVKGAISAKGLSFKSDPREGIMAYRGQIRLGMELPL
ncbi:hypothetical protein GIB67_007455 [Kingdonia uniflora]|uniref:Ribulose bisphosphate carboxylase large chain n=2 Tax=Streptophyta TaxID=35493 RepID=A0A7J7L4R7_9MAGN|nr:hypothetical protein GIB67_007455 [Kingdonia uniflora]